MKQKIKVAILRLVGFFKRNPYALYWLVASVGVYLGSAVAGAGIEAIRLGFDDGYVLWQGAVMGAVAGAVLLFVGRDLVSLANDLK